jgi:hypothetical protein
MPRASRAGKKKSTPRVMAARTPSDAETKNPRCSFCGQEQSETRRVVAGPGVFICADCLNLFQDTLATGKPDP